MLGDSGEVLESSAVAATAGEEETDAKLEDSGEIATVSGGGGGGGGSRWPRAETLALLRIRSEMDSAFRDSALKSPLWEQISRKMAELGYRRSGKKCKEKFENVYKYHKRTKEGRFSKPEGKSYRFFDELEAFENLHGPKSRTHKLPPTATATAPLVPWINSCDSSSGVNPTLLAKKQPTPLPFAMNHNSHTVRTPGYKTNPDHLAGINVPSLNLFSSSTSSSTASEEEEEEMMMMEGKRSRKRRKHFKGLFKRLTNDLMEKQEEMQKKFLETLERLEKERVAREEAWRIRETARINREYELLVHHRSEAAVKDAAIISFLQQQQQQQQMQQQKQMQQQQYRGDHTVAIPNDQKHDEIRIVEATSKKMNNNVEDSNKMLSPSSSRWPKAEVEALIRLRTDADANYQENGAKGSLWEEVSGGMRRLGFNRNAKRCKEKWENINKYFKKVKESKKTRPIDSKTCPYFHQLDAIYRDKNKTSALPLMATPQQQLLPPQETSEIGNQRDGVRDEERDSQQDDGREEEEEDSETGGFEMVLNKTCSPMDINNNVLA